LVFENLGQLKCRERLSTCLHCLCVEEGGNTIRASESSGQAMSGRPTCSHVQRKLQLWHSPPMVIAGLTTFRFLVFPLVAGGGGGGSLLRTEAACMRWRWLEESRGGRALPGCCGTSVIPVSSCLRDVCGVGPANLLAGLATENTCAYDKHALVSLVY
jgi:hypothetical protein